MMELKTAERWHKKLKTEMNELHLSEDQIDTVVLKQMVGHWLCSQPEFDAYNGNAETRLAMESIVRYYTSHDTRGKLGIK